MENNLRQDKCSQCSELIAFNKTPKVGKCLRDSKYKNPETDSCNFGSFKNPETN